MGRPNVIILGFYGRNNLGDDMFTQVLPELLFDFQCTFRNTDDLSPNEDFSKYVAMIIGCGEVIDSYFLEKLVSIISNFSGSVIGFGVGAAYPDELRKYHDLFDHIFLRSKADLSLLSTLIGTKYVHYLPDIGFRFSNFGSPRRDIGVFLAQPMNTQEYKSQAIQLIKNLSKNGIITLYSFNTSDNPNENDIIINREIAEVVNVRVDSTSYSTTDMIKIMSRLDFAICSRYHSHVFAMVTGCPFVSLATTRKVRSLLEDTNLTYLASTPLEKLWDQRLEISKQLLRISEVNRTLLQSKQLNNLIWVNGKRSRQKTNIDATYQEMRNLILSEGIDPDSGTMSEDAARAIATELCFNLTSNPGSKYLHGTIENLQSLIPGKLRSMIEWIGQDQRPEMSGIELTQYNQDVYEGFHRAGWAYIMKYLKSLQSSSGVILDTFADRTFLWGKWILIRKGIIPYTSLWTGIFHHCPNNDCENNAWEIVRSKEFRQSLPTCVGIICLSEYLSNWYRDRITELGYNIPVTTIYHPTIFVDRLWSVPEKITLVNVGAWYRNTFTLYRLSLPDVTKKALKGVSMDDYYPTNMEEIPNNKWGKSLRKYFPNAKMNDEIKRMIESVEIIEHLPDEEYDSLLSKVVVFLDLYDASAVNTIIECIVRNTPVLVNRLPAIEEYLGPDYPLFYNSYSEIPSLLTLDRIFLAHQFLKDKDKEFLRIETFITSLDQISTEWLRNYFNSKSSLQLSELVQTSKNIDEIWSRIKALPREGSIKVSSPAIDLTAAIYRIKINMFEVHTQVYILCDVKYSEESILLLLNNWHANSQSPNVKVAIYSSGIISHHSGTLTWMEKELSTSLTIDGTINPGKQIISIDMTIPNDQYIDPVRNPVQPIVDYPSPPVNPCR